MPTMPQRGSRLADRSSRVTPQRPQRLARRHGRRRTAARTPGHTLQVPRIVRDVHAGVFRRRTHCEFIEIRLARKNGPRFA